jgi:hypothetical protein
MDQVSVFYSPQVWTSSLPHPLLSSPSDPLVPILPSCLTPSVLIPPPTFLLPTFQFYPVCLCPLSENSNIGLNEQSVLNVVDMPDPPFDDTNVQVVYRL